MAQQIQLDQLTADQLQNLKLQIEKELEMFSQSSVQLQGAQQKFSACSSALEQMKQTEIGNEIMIPLTQSLYHKAELTSKKFVIDIGTGFFIEKDLTTALDYYKRKVEFLNKQLDSFDANIMNAKKNLQMIAGFARSRAQVQ